MGWTDRFRTAGSWIANTVIDGAATSLNVLGTLACVAGGAGLSVYNSLSNRIRTGYFGGVDINGTADLEITAPEFEFEYNQTIPFIRKFSTKPMAVPISSWISQIPRPFLLQVLFCSFREAL
jgi:hypothetical protein